MGCNVLTVLCVVCAVSTAYGQFVNKPAIRPKIPEVDQDCMECICQASSNCDTTIKCHNSGGGYFCGAYVVSWGYWHDGGKPGDRGRKHDFETCLNNKTCAEEAVRGYMRKHGRDCDGDATVTCHDFARIHKLGYGACDNSAIESSDYWQKFEVCYDYGQSSDDAAAGDETYDYGDANVDADVDARRRPTG